MDIDRQHQFDRAKKYYSEGKFSKSEELLKSLIQTDPKDSDSHFLLANIFHLKGKIGSAIRSFKKVLELNGDHTDAMISLSVLYNDIGRYEEAKKYFEVADRKVKNSDNGVVDNHINKKFSVMHFEIAEMYFSYGRYEEALTEYSKAKALDPANLNIRVKIAKVYSKKKYFSKAIEELRLIKSDNPNFLPARLALGLQYYSNGKVIEAQSEWRNILHKDPDHKEARMYLKLSQSATEVSL